MRILIFIVLLLLISFSFQFSGPIPVLRYTKKFQPQHSKNFHFYTGDVKELGFTMKDSWICEGAIGFMYPTQVPNTIPLYRYVNKNAHYYTTNQQEGEKVGGNICRCGGRGCNCRSGEMTYPLGKFSFERIEGYVFPSQISGAIPVYRKSGRVTIFQGRGGTSTVGTDYLYTIDPNESNDYANEGVAFYILPLTPIQHDTSDASLWKKFRDHLVVELSKSVCGGQIECEISRNSGFQLITHPMTALWHKDPQDLNNDFCYTTKYGASFNYERTSYDGQIDQIYKNFILKITPNDDTKNSFIKLMKQEQSTPGKCFPWQETSSKLNDWVNYVNTNIPANSNTFQSHFDVAFSFSQKNSWTDFGEYSGKTNFIRYVDNNVKLSDKNYPENMTLSDSERIEYSYTHHVQVYSTNRFDMTFTARAVKYIEISPASWFDKNMIYKYKNVFNSNGFPLLPIGVFVAINPKVQMTVSKSLFDSMEKHSNIKNWFIAGVKYDNKNFLSLSDLNGEKDKFEKIEKEFKSYGNEDFEELDDYLNMVLSDRGSERVDHVNIKNVVPTFEGEYQINFESNEPTPQIIGVVLEKF